MTSQVYLSHLVSQLLHIVLLSINDVIDEYIILAVYYMLESTGSGIPVHSAPMFSLHCALNGD